METPITKLREATSQAIATGLEPRYIYKILDLLRARTLSEVNKEDRGEFLDLLAEALEDYQNGNTPNPKRHRGADA